MILKVVDLHFGHPCQSECDGKDARTYYERNLAILEPIKQCAIQQASSEGSLSYTELPPRILPRAVVTAGKVAAAVIMLLL